MSLEEARKRQSLLKAKAMQGRLTAPQEPTAARESASGASPGEDTIAILRRVWEGSTPAKMARGAQAWMEDPAGTAKGVARELDTDVRTLAEGATFGFADEIAAAGSAALGQGTYEENLAAEQARDAAIEPGRRIAGNVAGAVASLPLLPLKGAGMLRAAGEGAALSGVAGAGFAKPGERLKGAATGATIGAVIPPALQGAARVAAPTVTKAVQTMRDMGVTPTAGQLFPKTVGRVEQSVASVPILGGAIRGGRLRAVEQFNIGAINHALSPIRKTLPKGTEAGYGAVKEAAKVISQGYDDVLGKIDARPDQRFANDLGRIAQFARTELDDNLRNYFGQQLKKYASLDRMKGGVMPGKEAKQIISSLSGQARKFQKDPDPFRQNLGYAFEDLSKAFSDMVKRSGTPDQAAQLTALDKAFARQLRIERATAMRGAKEGIFSPAQLANSARAMDTSLRRKRSAYGEALMQDMAEAGEQVLGPTVPDSGTPERLASMALLAGGPAYIDPLAMLGGAGLASLYTRPGQSTLAGLAAREAGPVGRGVAATLRELSVPAGVGSAVAAAQEK